MDFITLGYLGMFVSAFLAATILPLGSEFVFTALLIQNYDPVWLTLVATLGNTLGGLTSYYLGYLAKWDVLTRWFKVTPENVEKYVGWIHQYGAPVAFLCWLPIVGDVLAVGLGFARTAVFPTTLFMGLGKLFRFITLVYFWNGLTQ